MAYSSYDAYRPPSSMAHRSYSGHGGGYSYSDGGMHGDYSRYPYGEPMRGGYDEAYIGEGYGSEGYPMYGTQAVGPYYGGGGGAYDDYERPMDPAGMDYAGSFGAMTPRRRRSSSLSYHRQLSMAPYNESFYETHGRYNHAIKFRMKGSMRSGISLTDAMGGMRLSGSEYLKRYEINPDARGRIYLKVRWNGYSSLTYEIPVDSWDGRVRLSSLARRVARACVHFIQANRIPVSWDRVKLYHLEEASPGTWQPILAVY